jgi:hypothetical protein
MRIDATPFSGRLSHRFAEKIAEVRFISKAAFRGDSAKRVVGYQQKLLSPSYPSAYDVSMWRAIESRLEYSIEAVGGNSQDPNKIHYSNTGMQIRGNVCLYAACLPWRQRLDGGEHRLSHGIKSVAHSGSRHLSCPRLQLRHIW